MTKPTRFRPYPQVLPMVKAWVESSDYFNTPKPLFEFAISVKNLLCQGDINDKIVEMLIDDMHLVVYLHNRTNYVIPFSAIPSDLIDWARDWPQPTIKRCPLVAAAGIASKALGRPIRPVEVSQAIAAVGLKVGVGDLGIHYVNKIRTSAGGVHP